MSTESPTGHVPTDPSAIEALNRRCFCFTLDRDALARELDSVLGHPGLSGMVRERCPYAFAAQPVFVAAPHLRRMAQVVQAVETVVALPAFRAQALAGAPSIASLGPAPGPLGAFFGYDFHLDRDHLGLIEINTNAGGAMLNIVLARAQRACCAFMETMVPTLATVAGFELRIVDMFRHEWRLAGRAGPLTNIAIVDESPEGQYLYPEFLLFQQLFERHGIRAVIAGPEALDWRDGRLWHGDLAVDLVYNRLTDFYLEQATSAALRAAHVQQGAVLTPNPQAHALYADKRHLALFSDAARLQALGVPAATREVLLAHVPHTEVVDAAGADRLWDARRGLFFKPATGFGSRAAYRGDKLTRRVWQDILAGDYVAQAIVAPGERLLDDDVEAKALKFDLRAYAYDGEVQWVAARLYQGQTTNFRTPGGGFAPVYSTGDAAGRVHHARGEPAHGEAHASYIFLLGERGDVHAVPHAVYVALARAQVEAPELAGQTLRLADWYVRLQDGEPDTVVNETYSLIRFDARGRVDPPPTSTTRTDRPGSEFVPADAGWPTADEHARMRALLFDPPDPAVEPETPD